MKTFSEFCLNENSQEKAKGIINKASYRVSMDSYFKDATLTKLGFTLLSDSEINKLGVDYAYFSKATGKDLGMINLPKYIIQNHVTKDFVYDIIDKKTKITPIKVMKYKNDYVVLDGHHRLAAAKALNQKIHAVLIE